MIKFNEQEVIKGINDALALRAEIEKIVDGICKDGYTNILWLGIGGTYANAMQCNVHMKEKSAIENFYEEAAEFNATGNKRVTKDTVVVFNTVSGNTPELVAALKKIKEIGCRVIGFVDKPESECGQLTTYLMSVPGNSQIKLFCVGDRFMFNNGEFDDYAEYYKQLDANLAADLVAAEKKADDFGKEWAEKHWNDAIHYYIAAGHEWGSTYSFAMCYMEEMHWCRTKSIHAAEFFHGTLEIIEKGIPVTVYVSEDSQRPLCERVVKFLPKVTDNITVIDTKDYDMPGIDEKYRGAICQHIAHAINSRIDAHLEAVSCHPMTIRRYYRQFEY